VGVDKLELETGLDVIPRFPKESTDRNRTSPLAFTGDKFEFRMLGASFSGSESSMVMNTIVAQALKEFADVLENDRDALDKLLKETIHKHKRVIFNGNNYSDEWEDTARERGLIGAASTVDALPYYTDEKTLKLFGEHDVMSVPEIEARREIVTENYINTIKTEALVLLDMARREIMPAAGRFSAEMSRAVTDIRESGIMHCDHVRETLEIACTGVDVCAAVCKQLYKELRDEHPDSYAAAKHYRTRVLPLMMNLRKTIDALERIVPEWPMPTYSDLLFWE